MKSMKWLLVVAVAVISLDAAVKAQGIACKNHNSQNGVCIMLPNCASLYDLYENDKTIQSYRIVSTNQDACKNRFSGKNPLVCCSDGDVASPNSLRGVSPSTTLPSTTATPRTATTASTPRNVNGVDCQTPDNLAGSCKEIVDCQSARLLLEKRGPINATIINYLQKSNSKCGSVPKYVCCPIDVITKPPSTTRTQAHLTTLEEGCGFTPVLPDRVFGGKEARKGAWPWMALLGYQSNRAFDVSWKCGGTIISKRHILTASHCVVGGLKVVRMGDHKISDNEEAVHVDIEIKEIISNPSYDKIDGHSDLAILILEKDIEFNDHIKPICIPLEGGIVDKNYEGISLYFAGWGKTNNTGGGSDTLQQVRLPLLSNSVCRDTFIRLNQTISDKQFDDAILCAGDLNGEKDTCRGDSGGPMMMAWSPDNENFRFYQLGVVSYGPGGNVGCAAKDVPAVYSNVRHFAQWIKKTVEEHQG